MKLHKLWVFKLLLYTIMIVFVSVIIYYMELYPIPPLPGKEWTIKYINMFFYFALFLISCVAAMDIVYGTMFVKVKHVPMKDFNIETFDNIYIVRYREKAFPVAKYNKSWLKKETIKVTDYYNRKKEHVSWDTNIPYMRNR